MGKALHREFTLPRDELAVLAGRGPTAHSDERRALEAASQLDAPHGPGLADRVLELAREVETSAEASSFETWFAAKAHESEREATRRLRDGVERLRRALDGLTDEKIEAYVHTDRVSDLGLGSRVREAVLMKIAEELRTTCVVARTEQAVDGWLGERPVVIRPLVLRDRLIDESEGDLVFVYYTPRPEGGLDLVLQG